MSEEEGARWAAEHDCQYFETSACSGASVTAVFTKLLEMALAKMGAVRDTKHDKPAMNPSKLGY